MKKRTFFNLVFISIFVLMTFAFTILPSDEKDSPAWVNVQAQEGTYKSFLPYSYRTNEATPWGIQMDSHQLGGELDRMSAAGANWTRRDLVWSVVEPTPGARNWDANLEFENSAKNAASNEMQMIAILGSTPAWAAKPGYPCGGAVAQEHFQRLGNFAYDVVRRLSAHPYNIRHWELWNEPDVSGSLGCWGDPNDPYYGGSYYAEMLKVVYPRIKAADSNAQVLVGGLLLDCDPRVPVVDPQNNAQMKDCTPARFLEGILLNNGGGSFNGVSFHAYDYYNTDSHYYNPNWNSSQMTTGPVTLVKARFLQDQLNAAGLHNKYLINTETALFCSVANCEGSEFTRAKNSYILESYASSMAYGLKSIIWWSAMGYRSSGLLNADYSPQPAYYAYQFARQKLGRAVYVRQLNQPGIMGYEFRVENRLVWVLRSLNGSPINVPLSNPSVIYKLGDNGLPVIVESTNSIVVDLQPVLIEF